MVKKLRYLRMRYVGVLLLSLAAGACAFAPGMRMDESSDGPDYSTTDANGHPVAFIPITPDLVRDQRALAARNGDVADLASLVTATPRVRYAVGTGDVLQITLWDHPELNTTQGIVPNSTTPQQFDPSPGFLVDELGNIEFPYAGTVHVAGLSSGQIQHTLVARLARNFREPQVTVRVSSYRSKRIFVDGFVRQPGVLTVTDAPLSLFEAITRAGGFADIADQSRLVLTRNRVNYVIDIPAAIKAGIPLGNIYLQADDILRVPTLDDARVYLLGEVTTPRSVNMRPDGMTLTQALGEVGGVAATTSNPHQVYVIRNAGGDHPEVFHLDAKSPVAFVVADQFHLQPRDVVYVDAGELVRFNRVVNLLLPNAISVVGSAAGVATATK